MLIVGFVAGGAALAQDLQMKSIPPPKAQEAEEKKAAEIDSKGSSQPGSTMKPGAPMKPGISPKPGTGQLQQAPGGTLKAGQAVELKAKLPKEKHRPKIHFDCKTIMCIERVRVNPHGTYVEFEVITTQPARVTIETSLNPPKGNEFARVERAIFTVKPMISSKTQITGLAATEDYYYIAQAKDAGGIIQWHHGKFSMGGRNVRMEIQRIYATNDGDDGANGAGEFEFDFVSQGEKLAMAASVTTGKSINVSRSLSLAGVPPSVPIKVGVVEKDGILVKTRRYFEKSFNVETTGPGENDAVPFEWRLTSTDFDLTLHGKFHVSYGN
jgi:hypothetical protein